MEVLDFIESTKYSPEKIIEIPNTTREDLAVLFGHFMRYGLGAEIGVEQGVFSETICKSNGGLLLYCVDAWTPHKEYRDHITQSKFDSFYSTTKERLKEYHTILIRKFSMDAVKSFAPESLDFVYIDANHRYSNVYEDITEWSGRVRSGGIVSGHDYIDRKFPKDHNVIGAVNDYVRDNNISPLYLFGRKKRVEGEVRERARSWMFIKP